jgi:hypothetical protein
VGRRVSRRDDSVGLVLGLAMVYVVWWLLVRYKVTGRRGSFRPVEWNINLLYLLVCLSVFWSFKESILVSYICHVGC